MLPLGYKFQRKIQFAHKFQQWIRSLFSRFDDKIQPHIENFESELFPSFQLDKYTKNSLKLYHKMLVYAKFLIAFFHMHKIPVRFLLALDTKSLEVNLILDLFCIYGIG